MKKWIVPIILVVFISGVGVGIYFEFSSKNSKLITPDPLFDSENAFNFAQYQVFLGPRTTGSLAHEEVVRWMQTQLMNSGWSVQLQEGVIEGHAVQNVIGERGDGSNWILLGAHYDSRLESDQDPNLSYRLTPVPGADDGASGVAILLELAKSLPIISDTKITIVLFDAEDDGGIGNWDWLLGSEYYVSQLQEKPDKVIVLDMVGDSDLNIYKELNSDKAITDSIWAQAAALGYEGQFIDQYKYRMLDDHTPFLEAGIPAIDIIDFDYPYWHTTEDTMDKISKESLQEVGDTLWYWLKSQ